MKFQMVICGEVQSPAAASTELASEVLSGNLQSILELAKRDGRITADLGGELVSLTHSIEVTEPCKAAGSGESICTPGADGRIFGMRPEQLAALQGGGMDCSGQWFDPAAKAQRDREELDDRRKLVLKQQSDLAERMADATSDPRIMALAVAGIPAPQVLQASKELREGDESLLLDLARIHDITLPDQTSSGEIDLGIPAVYQGEYGWGFEGCESDGFATELAARIAALQEISAELEPHIAVEYDIQFSGGGYEGVGDLIYIPTKLLDAMPPADGVDHVHACFAHATRLPSTCIITYSQDTLYTRSGRFYRL